MELMDFILAEPLPLVAWVMVLMVMNTASIFFLKRVEARWVLAAWIPNGIFMSYLLTQFGYTRMLGLSHVVFWTPLLVYLWRRRAQWNVSGSLTGKWLVGLFGVNLASLLVDYVDVVRYLLGDHSALG